MSASAVGAIQNGLFTGNNQNITLVNGSAYGRALLAFVYGFIETGTASAPTFNGVAPTFSASKSSLDESTSGWAYVSVNIWMNADLPSSAGTYVLNSAGGSGIVERRFSVQELALVNSASVILTADVANARNTPLALSLPSVPADSLNYALFNINPGYSADWVNVNSDAIVFSGSGFTYNKPVLFSRHGAVGNLTFTPTNAGSGEGDSYYNWYYGAAISIQSAIAGTVNAGDPVYPTQYDVAITTGDTFTSAATVTLIYAGVSQVQDYSWVNANSLTITQIDQGALPFGPITVRIEEGSKVEDIAAVLEPYPDHAVVTVTTPDLSSASVFYNLSVGTPTAGWLIESDNSQNVTFSSDGSYVAEIGVSTVNVRLWNDDAPAWTEWFAYTINTSSGDNNQFFTSSHNTTQSFANAGDIQQGSINQFDLANIAEFAVQKISEQSVSFGLINDADFSNDNAQEKTNTFGSSQSAGFSVKQNLNLSVGFGLRNSGLFSAETPHDVLGLSNHSNIANALFSAEIIKTSVSRPAVKFIIKRDGRIFINT